MTITVSANEIRGSANWGRNRSLLPQAGEAIAVTCEDNEHYSLEAWETREDDLVFWVHAWDADRSTPAGTYNNLWEMSATLLTAATLAIGAMPQTFDFHELEVSVQLFEDEKLVDEESEAAAWDLVEELSAAPHNVFNAWESVGVGSDGWFLDFQYPCDEKTDVRALLEGLAARIRLHRPDTTVVVA